MEQKFKEYLENHIILKPSTINVYADALSLRKEVYNAVREAIKFNNFYEIEDIDLFLEKSNLIKNIIPNKDSTNNNGHDHGNLSAALKKYKLFLQYLEIIEQTDLYDENPDAFDVSGNVRYYFEVFNRNNKYPIIAICKNIADKLEPPKTLKKINGGLEKTVLDVAKEQLKNIFKKNINFYDSNLQENESIIDEKLQVPVEINKQLQQAIKLLKYKKQIIMQGSPGTGKTRLSQDIAYYLIKDKALDNDKNKRQKQLKSLMQFTPVIQRDTNAPIVFEDYLISNQTIPTVIGHSKFTITEITEKHIKITLSTGKPHDVLKRKVIDRFNNQNWTRKNGLTSYEGGIAKYIFDIRNNEKNKKTVSTQNIPLNLKQYKLIQFHPAYSYEDFVRGIVATTTGGVVNYEVQNKVLAEMAKNAVANPNEKFVLIIDEINRANLSAVLGELIYALEYRGAVVESMYAIDGSRAIILPENLYIIGTMNTADRSVGHIDYAIRRRFAFVNVDTDRKIVEINHSYNLYLFDKVESLFNNHLSEEFDKDDVMIGHSYFLNDDLEMALEYEIKPILLEYVKDGVLTCEKSMITDLNVSA